MGDIIFMSHYRSIELHKNNI